MKMLIDLIVSSLDYQSFYAHQWLICHAASYIVI